VTCRKSPERHRSYTSVKCWCTRSCNNYRPNYRPFQLKSSLIIFIVNSFFPFRSLTSVLPPHFVRNKLHNIATAQLDRGLKITQTLKTAAGAKVVERAKHGIPTFSVRQYFHHELHANRRRLLACPALTLTRQEHLMHQGFFSYLSLPTWVK